MCFCTNQNKLAVSCQLLLCFAFGVRKYIIGFKQIVAFCCSEHPSVAHFQLILRLELISMLWTQEKKIKKKIRMHARHCFPWQQEEAHIAWQTWQICPQTHRWGSVGEQGAHICKPGKAELQLWVALCWKTAPQLPAGQHTATHVSFSCADMLSLSSISHLFGPIIVL